MRQTVTRMTITKVQAGTGWLANGVTVLEFGKAAKVTAMINQTNAAPVYEIP